MSNRQHDGPTATRKEMIDDILRWTSVAPDVLHPLSDGTIDLLHCCCFLAREDGKESVTSTSDKSEQQKDLISIPDSILGGQNNQ